MLWHHVLLAGICGFNYKSAGAALPSHSPESNGLSFGELNYYKKVIDHSHDDCVDRLQKRQGTTDAAVPIADVSSYRFYDNATAPFLIESLPDVPFDLGEIYSGNLPIGGNASRQLFFVFQPTTGAPVDEITIWFNGGPGCSSLEGFFEENGRIVWRNFTAGPLINKYAWTNQTNMLWIEQPIGVGFTQGDAGYTKEEQIAQDVVGFLKNFMTTFQIDNFTTYVTGESYAGRYVPYVSSAILDQTDDPRFKLGGALIYDGTIGAFTHTQERVVAVPFVQQNNQFFGFNDTFLSELQEAYEDCGYVDIVDTYLTFPPPGNQPIDPGYIPGRKCNPWNTILYEAERTNPCFDLYEVNTTCPTALDPLQDSVYPSLPGEGPGVYFNQDDVKKAMHANTSIAWRECSVGVFTGGNGVGGPEFEGDLSPDPIQGILPRVIEATNRVLIANGDLDYIIITNGTLLAIQNMTWNGMLGFQQRPSLPIDIDGTNHGLQHEERGLMWVETFGAGHMGPEYDGASSYRHLQWLRGEIDSL